MQDVQTFQQSLQLIVILFKIVAQIIAMFPYKQNTLARKLFRGHVEFVHIVHKQIFFHKRILRRCGTTTAHWWSSTSLKPKILQVIKSKKLIFIVANIIFLCKSGLCNLRQFLTKFIYSKKMPTFHLRFKKLRIRSDLAHLVLGKRPSWKTFWD